jgi:hypothetical protein
VVRGKQRTERRKRGRVIRKHHGGFVDFRGLARRTAAFTHSSVAVLGYLRGSHDWYNANHQHHLDAAAVEKN